VLQARAFSELISYIEDNIENGTYLFKLKDLYDIFINRLQALGISKTINKTRLKDDIMGNFLGRCVEESDGRNTILIFKQGLKELLKDKFESRDFESEALLASKLAKTIRKEIFQWEKNSFSGHFSPTCQSESVPPLLKYLISMIIKGQDVAVAESSADSQACLTISQLIYFNAKSNFKEKSKKRHGKHQEPPLPVYLGIRLPGLSVSSGHNICLSFVKVTIWTVASLLWKSIVETIETKKGTVLLSSQHHVAVNRVGNGI